ncbi:hypothetical protein RhiirC2_720891 [Rhizophagus irregularis]|uniref:Uncharacterized protein n=1 Tax=Rhizophagus irregularis TaxID=588596 RepID=A0A2N1M8H0_9GLOM|nr:hypothetical protein RhiirC2_720891 [Rhizophagus irregularis]
MACEGFSGSSSDSSSRSGKRKKPKKSATITPKRYQRVSELSKNMKEALRRDLFWNLARMPEDAQLDIEQTFESQKDKVTKTIVPTLMKTLDLVTYPIGEGVIYDMMHRRHRHQREHARNKKKSQIERKREAERKHNNSRRLEKRKKRTRTISKLREINDPLIEKFKEEELLPITTNSGYHSPEYSEEENEINKIVVRNLRWRSSTLRRFLFYLDQNTTKGITKRTRVYDSSQSVDEVMPLDAPDWTKSGYDGPLKILTTKAVNKYISK